MAGLFLDSSAIAKRYVRETGSAWIDGLFDPNAKNRIYISNVTGVEVVAAISRRSHNLRPANQIQLLIAEFRNDYLNLFRIIQTDEMLLFRAMDLAQKHRLRGYDALQLSAAFEVHSAYLATAEPAVLISADEELNAAALAEGLLVQNPNQYP